MDHINSHKLSTSTWELAMSMEDQILHDHHHRIPLTSLYPIQDHHHHHFLNHHQQQLLPSSSSFICEPRGKLNNNNNQYQVVEVVQEPQVDQEAEEEEEELGAMKEMMFKIAAMQPVDIDPATIHKPKRRNVRISDDPQSVAARHRRERISEKIRILQRLVPGGTKMDTASMLEEAGRYIKFLKRQIKQLQANHQSQCIGMMNDCLSSEELQRMTSNKPVVEHIGSASASFSMEIPLVQQHLHFNHHEVISDNQYN